MSNELITEEHLYQELANSGFTGTNAYEGRLILVELAVKANAGYRNSHTEERFLSAFRLLKKDRTLNKFGRKFICSMFYSPSLKKSKFVIYSEMYRR
jgi:hypothetical protein